MDMAFVAGLFVGATIGVFMMGILSVAKEDNYED